ncbi:adenosylmethionine--8-amino-7-oxononanoate transaminase [Buchnera aphidicola]|uniref:Adenosylmethionine-8-amino-7-oxononanoate aminotransferase n=1 Tax=Buchnera aphidicola str. USDA (Myzus persicae) TaxID=1009856 RepID=W0P3Z8_BUCMP|nr:adenosylmethionine--8-amino-7-oxononanoate transaminase [Buchnera aphidicola]AHG60090.1 Bioa [Buchnera aphidicola str. USDA (Myzus persicae)]AHG60670.1 Bioa [Buchnera aphidicola str. W106 (Myzus persicae)]AHG61242.1 Bioa [Buchnera aphidicola str. G002 (Myzus persicae)]AHG61815.1 Bioa [Buchnera aphidicola str. F009 (Myzus persicae)]WAI03221.1 MAG: adenosylmethionine--8-amino-7-oxononanoate transaminase [Buchnera aphidicola (Myzus persicae)]
MSQSDKNFDYKHIWHPYSSMINPIPCYSVMSAKGVYLKLQNGRKIIDGMSSWWSAIHGYNHPILNKSLKKQIKKMSHVMFGGITHPSAISLCRKLISLTPKTLDCVFLSDSGSVAIEVAIKMLIQYWHSLGQKRISFLTIRKGYHGDTFAAMSVSDPENSIHQIYHNILSKNLFANAPISSFHKKWDSNDLVSFQKIIEENSSKIAGVILEPIVQGVGGMNFYHPKYLKKIKILCHNYNIPLIFDEIATGFGRTGKFFSFQHADVIPDILCLGKALTGGTITLAATLTTRHIANIISMSKVGCFMHGPTYMGNPLACAAANANIKILETNQWKIQVSNIEKQLYKNLTPLIDHPYVIDVRILGAIGVIECSRLVNMPLMQKFFVNNGVWIRPFKKLIYIVPPYIISTNELNKLINVITQALNDSSLFL